MINPAAPEGAPPRRINDGNLLKPPCPAVPRRGPEAGNHRTIMDFHCLGVNARSYTFQQSLLFKKILSAPLCTHQEDRELPRVTRAGRDLMDRCGITEPD